jgi:hypothetical protein
MPIPVYSVKAGLRTSTLFFHEPPEYNMKRLFAPFLLAAGATLLSVASYGQAINSVPYPVGTFVTFDAPGAGTGQKSALGEDNL